MARETPVYALYDGDTFVDIGTAKELGELLGIKPKNVSWLATPAYRKRRHHPEKGRVVIRLEDEDETYQN